MTLYHLFKLFLADVIQRPYNVVIKSTFLTYVFFPTLLYISKMGKKLEQAFLSS